jgi:phosphoribosylformylglycinamidine synthase I
VKAAVCVFPGSNCDRDAARAIREATGVVAPLVWHEEVGRTACDLWVLPGGFSYGDYLRAGALAALSPAIDTMRRHVAAGGLLLGICNGFQVLVEAGFLEGAFQTNDVLHFRALDVFLRVASNRSPFLSLYEVGEVIDLPIAHGEGSYQVDEAEAVRLEAQARVALQYCDASGGVHPGANPNGSMHAIAGVTDQTGRVLGMMPHPERNAEPLFGSAHGRRIFQGALGAQRRSVHLGA